MFKSTPDNLMNIDRIINIVRKLNEEMMTTGAGGGASFAGTGPDDNGSPTAGYDKPLDGRCKMMRRLPPEYRKSLQKTKKKKR